VELSFMRWTRSETFMGSEVYIPAERVACCPYTPRMHYDAHQPVLNDLEARITTIRDSL
jgi:hypothetical protein